MLRGELREKCFHFKGSCVAFGRLNVLSWPDFPHGVLGSSAELVPWRKASGCKVISVAGFRFLTGIIGLWRQTDEMRGRLVLAVSFLTQDSLRCMFCRWGIFPVDHEELSQRVETQDSPLSVKPWPCSL